MSSLNKAQSRQKEVRLGAWPLGFGGEGRAVVSELRAQGDGILSFAWPAGLVAGKAYEVVGELVTETLIVPIHLVVE